MAQPPNANTPLATAAEQGLSNEALNELLQTQQATQTQLLSESEDFYTQDTFNALQALLRGNPHALQFDPTTVVGAPHSELEEEEHTMNVDIVSTHQQSPAPGDPSPSHGEEEEAQIEGALNVNIESTVVAALIPSQGAPIVHTLRTSLMPSPRIAEVCEDILEHSDLNEHPVWTRARDNPARFSVVLLPRDFAILSRTALSTSSNTILIAGPLDAVLLGAAGSLEVPLSTTGVPQTYQDTRSGHVFLVHLVEDIDRLVESQRIVAMVRQRFQGQISAFIQAHEEGHRYAHTVYLLVASYMLCRELFASLLVPGAALPPNLMTVSAPFNRLRGQPLVGMRHFIQTLPMLLNVDEQERALAIGQHIHRFLLHGRTGVAADVLNAILQHRPEVASKEEVDRITQIREDEVMTCLSTLEEPAGGERAEGSTLEEQTGGEGAEGA